MSVRLRYGQTCSMVDCLAPARELGGLCSMHWRAASPEMRSDLKWEASWATVPAVDPATLTDWDIVRAAEAMLGD